MKRIAFVFLIGILLPAALLAVLAIRSVKDQEMIANSQRAIAYQAACDARAAEINLFMDDVRVFYGQLVDDFVQRGMEGSLSRFHQEIRDGWSQAAVGACISEGGQILSPRPGASSEVDAFLENHADFLTNRRVVEVYEAPALLYSQIQVVAEEDPFVPGESAEEGESSNEADFDRAGSELLAEKKAKTNPWRVEASQNRYQEYRFEKQQSNLRQQLSLNQGNGEAESMRARNSEESEKLLQKEDAQILALDEAIADVEQLADSNPPGAGAGQAPQAAPAVAAPQSQPEEQTRSLGRSVPPSQRTVAPSQYASAPEWLNAQPQAELMEASNVSQVSSDVVRFNDLAESEKEGAVSRIIDGELHVLLWKRPELKPDHVFWVELDMEQIERDIEPLFAEPKMKLSSLSSGVPEMSLALLDTTGDMVTQTVGGFETDWSRPFVAAEVGQILPRWEVASYLLNPNAVSKSARTVGLLLVWLVGLSLIAVAVGSFLIFRSVNYEMRMAARKTDFVSNVSHELKTPLTSIRMFSDLLAKSEQEDIEKTQRYSEVISKESARLSRLIHRLLDFSRLERGEMPLESNRIDLVQLVPETVEQYRPHIAAEGIELQVDKGKADNLLVEGDADAISQVLLNLLSNAEKYGAKGGEILVEIFEEENDSVVRVHDRGPGVPRALQKKIFEKFYRVDESINSGIEGSGIGLALSRQIMDRLGGSLQYESRLGGGSTFSIHLPKAKS